MAEQMNLPALSWDEEASVRSEDGRKLRRWGSVREAQRMLWGVNKHEVYDLLRAGIIRAVRRPGGKTKWRVDLVSVWEYKTKVEKS